MLQLIVKIRQLYKQKKTPYSLLGQAYTWRASQYVYSNVYTYGTHECF